MPLPVCRRVQATRCKKVQSLAYCSNRSYVLANSGVLLITARRNNRPAHPPTDANFIRTHRRRIETLNSQLEAMGAQHLHPRTVDGFLIKVHVPLLALVCSLFD